MALLALRRRLSLALRRLDEAGLDAELAEAEALVDLQAHLGPGEERQVVAARVLQEVGGELLLERALVALEALVVLRAEPDRVLVGHVDARDRGGAVRVHLLGELARDLDGLDLRREGARERTLNQVLNPCFEVSKDAYVDSPCGTRVGRAAPPPAARVEPGILDANEVLAAAVERRLGAGERWAAVGLVPVVRARAGEHRQSHDHDRDRSARALRAVADVSEACGEARGPDDRAHQSERRVGAKDHAEQDRRGGAGRRFRRAPRGR